MRDLAVNLTSVPLCLHLVAVALSVTDDVSLRKLRDSGKGLKWLQYWPFMLVGMASVHFSGHHVSCMCFALAVGWAKSRVSKSCWSTRLTRLGQLSMRWHTPTSTCRCSFDGNTALQLAV